MIDFAFWEYLKTQTIYEVKYGSANNVATPYFVVYKLDDSERPETLCQEQGDSGRALFIVEGFTGGQSMNSTPDYALQLVETFRNNVNSFTKMDLTFNGVDYRIWYNRTTASIPIDRGSNEVAFYGAQFSVLLYWEII